MWGALIAQECPLKPCRDEKESANRIRVVIARNVRAQHPTHLLLCLLPRALSLQEANARLEAEVEELKGQCADVTRQADDARWVLAHLSCRQPETVVLEQSIMLLLAGEEAQQAHCSPPSCEVSSSCHSSDSSFRLSGPSSTAMCSS